MHSIVLVGFMGSGKTTIAMKLSHRLNLRYISTDDMIEKSQKCTINEIFTRKGEDYFRDVEAQAVREACSMDNVIIDLGGGAVIRDENWESIRASGVSVCLIADEETIMERTKKYKHRPLLNVEDPKQKIRNLMAKRSPFYSKADHCIDTGKLTVKQAVEKIAGIFEECSKNAGAK
jgi:shikimate kinase